MAGARVSREGAGYIWEWAGARLPLVRVRPQRRSPPRSSRASRPRRWRTAPWTWRAWVPCAHRPSSSVTARRSPSPAPCRPPPVLSLRALRGRAGGGLRRRGPRPGAGLAPRLSGAGGEGGGGGTGGPRLGRGRAPAVTAARSPAARRPLSPPPPPPPPPPHVARCSHVAPARPGFVPRAARSFLRTRVRSERPGSGRPRSTWRRGGRRSTCMGGGPAAPLACRLAPGAGGEARPPAPGVAGGGVAPGSAQDADGPGRTAPGAAWSAAGRGRAWDFPHPACLERCWFSVRLQGLEASFKIIQVWQITCV